MEIYYWSEIVDLRNDFKWNQLHGKIYIPRRATRQQRPRFHGKTFGITLYCSNIALMNKIYCIMPLKESSFILPSFLQRKHLVKIDIFILRRCYKAG